MQRSPLAAQSRSLVPLDPAEVAMADVGWRRVGPLQRLGKLEREAESVAIGDRTARTELTQRRAA